MTEVVYHKTVMTERMAAVPVSMSVMAGDMVGFHVPEEQLQLHTSPNAGFTIYRREQEEPISSLCCLPSVVGPSPYITVVFGECFSAIVYIYTIFICICSSVTVHYEKT